MCKWSVNGDKVVLLHNPITELECWFQYRYQILFTQQDFFSLNKIPTIGCFESAYCSCYLLFFFSLPSKWKVWHRIQNSVQAAAVSFGGWFDYLRSQRPKPFFFLLQTSSLYEPASAEGVWGTRQQAQFWTGVTLSLLFVWGVKWIIHELITNSWMEQKLICHRKAKSEIYLELRHIFLDHICYMSVKLTDSLSKKLLYCH